jgi:hypothetical protein
MPSLRPFTKPMVVMLFQPTISAQDMTVYDDFSRG